MLSTAVLFLAAGPAVVVLIHRVEQDDAGIATIVGEVLLGVLLGNSVP